MEAQGNDHIAMIESVAYDLDTVCESISWRLSDDEDPKELLNELLNEVFKHNQKIYEEVEEANIMLSNALETIHDLLDLVDDLHAHNKRIIRMNLNGARKK